MVGLVGEDPVRAPRLDAKLLQPWEECAEERWPVLQRQADQARDDVGGRLLERRQYLALTRAPIGAAEMDRAGKLLVVPFRVDDAELVTLGSSRSSTPVARVDFPLADEPATSRLTPAGGMVTSSPPSR